MKSDRTRKHRSTPLARRLYGLRHAAVSRWLAGHSLTVLMEIYAACPYGQDVVSRQRVQTALGHAS
ncbi:hypothetical protein [Prauserella endophytica]|uniref:Integrase n=1 Tax=Prauserella endophytica TaxID=1592324 RepID=A0ABY2RWT9_9PSEU|nr:hypothetical protein [Prauserella endophytica]TKG63762.1 hypothetical protein FCN18_29440 [Prauserella endophytica]